MACYAKLKALNRRPSRAAALATQQHGALWNMMISNFFDYVLSKARMQTCMYMYKYIQMCIYIYMYMCVYVHICIHIYIYTYVYTYVQKHRYTYTHIRISMYHIYTHR